MKIFFTFSRLFRYSFALVFVLIICNEAFAGGPWVLGKGQADLSIGFSRKVGKQRWAPTVDNNETSKNYADDIITYSLITPADSTTVDGKFHDFRYYYFQGAVGLAKNLELNWTINWLVGREASRTNPKTGQLYQYPEQSGPNSHYAIWEINEGFTDSWLGLKYQFLHKNWPMAIEINSRFPDLYNQPGHEYTRYNYQYTSQTIPNGDTSYIVKDTLIEPSSEWRGLNKRDFAALVHFGHSFFKDGALYFQGYGGYNIRQGAFADQVMFNVNAGYTWRINNHLFIIPSVLFDYIGGVGNGGQPDLTDRFFSVYKNYNFNNSKAFRGYANLDVVIYNRFAAKIGVGQWLAGKGAVKYSEAFVQLNYLIRNKCD